MLLQLWPDGSDDPIKPYAPLMRHAISGVLGYSRPDINEDLFSDARLSLLVCKKFLNAPHSGAKTSFAMRTAKNKALDYQKSKSKQLESEECFDSLLNLASKELRPDEVMYYRAVQELAMAGLPPKYQPVLEMMIRGYNDRQIVHELGMTYSKVATGHQKIRQNTLSNMRKDVDTWESFQQNPVTICRAGELFYNDSFCANLLVKYVINDFFDALAEEKHDILKYVFDTKSKDLEDALRMYCLNITPGLFADQARQRLRKALQDFDAKIAPFSLKVQPPHVGCDPRKRIKIYHSGYYVEDILCKKSRP